MFSNEELVRCPVGKNTLGYRSKKEISTLLCKDCGFLFTWNSKGKLLPPVKYVPMKEKQECGCGRCVS